MATRTVQFRNIADIIQTYQNAAIPAFAIFTGNQMFLDYEGDDIDEGSSTLTPLLEMLERNKSAAIYSLMLYKKVPDDGITNKTPYNGSFNFRLTDEIQGYGTVAGVRNDEVSALRSEVSAMKKLLEEVLEAEEDITKGEETLVDKISGILNNPQLQPVLTPIMEGIGKMIAGIVNKSAPTAIEDNNLKKVV